MAPHLRRTAEPPLYVEGKCPHCGAPAQILNGLWFRWHRSTRAVSLREVARRGGLSAAFVSDFERGRRAWSDRLVNAYGIGALRTMQKWRATDAAPSVDRVTPREMSE